VARHTDHATAAKLDAIYARLPTIACRRVCGRDICGPIFMTVREADRARRAVHASPRTDPDLTCAYLTPGGACRVYGVRPLICRVFGLVKRMSCPHGCVPDRWMTDQEFVALAREVETVGGAHVMTSPDGLVPYEGSFHEIDTSRTPPDVIERFAEMTLGLRALHGGRVIGVTPRDDDASVWIDVDDLRKDD
jgi:uncharacterized protein